MQCIPSLVSAAFLKRDRGEFSGVWSISLNTEKEADSGRYDKHFKQKHIGKIMKQINRKMWF